MLYNKKELKGIREYIIKSFTFCYNIVSSALSRPVGVRWF